MWIYWYNIYKNGFHVTLPPINSSAYSTASELQNLLFQKIRRSYVRKEFWKWSISANSVSGSTKSLTKSTKSLWARDYILPSVYREAHSWYWYCDTITKLTAGWLCKSYFVCVCLFACFVLFRGFVCFVLFYFLNAQIEYTQWCSKAHWNTCCERRRKRWMLNTLCYGFSA